MRKQTKKVVAAVLAMVLGLSAGTKSMSYDAMAQGMNGVHQGKEAKTEAVYTEDDFIVKYTLENQWDEGYNASVEIENTGEYVLDNWYLYFASANEFTTVWNGEIVWYEEGQYIIKNAGWNQDIAPGQKVSFGIGCNQEFAGFPEKYELLGRTSLVLSEGYDIAYQTESSWDGGVEGRITLTNHTEEMLEDWSLGFLYEQEITELWNAELVEKDGQRYLLENAGYNGNVAPGQTVTIGFTAIRGADVVEPHGYQLFSYRMSELDEETTVDETLDSDGDGLPDYMEHYFETDISRVDTDGDGLSDYMEIMILKTEALLQDTDGDGVKDGEEDADGDGYSNDVELALGTDLVKADTDSDGITDYEEGMIYGTDALRYDTDGDGASDGIELRLGTNPNEWEKTFRVCVKSENAYDPAWNVTVEAEVNGTQIEKLTLKQVTDDIVFSDTMPGYIGSAYIFETKEQPVSARISFEYLRGQIEEGVVPAIYGFCDTKNVLEELETAWEDNVVTTEVGEYSRYIVLDKAEFEKTTSPVTFMEEFVNRGTGVPMLRAARAVSDKDYDGQADNADAAPLNNRFTGTLSTSYATGAVDFSMDYRWFFRDNTVYNPDLSKVSVLLSSVAYHGSSLSIKDAVNSNTTNKADLRGVLSYLGMSNAKTIALGDRYSDIHTSEVGLGYRTVSYNGQEKNIVAVVVRGTNSTIEEWSSNFEIGDSSKFATLSDWKTRDNHAGFDIAANRIMREVDAFVVANGLNASNTVYWITGHSRGAAIANIIGAYYENTGKKAFTYTFATPNTTLASNAANYRTIFNIVNTDDLVPYMPMGAWGYSRYGRTANRSVADSYEKEWENFTDIFDYNPDTIGMQDVVDELGGIVKKDARVNCYKYTCRDHGDGSNDTITITNYGMSKKSREGAIAKIPANALPYCKITRYDGFFIAGWDFDVCQSPAYFMQILAAIMASEITPYRFTVELNIADRYESAKTAIIASYIGGVEHPHYPESYYVLSNHVSAGDF